MDGRVCLLGECDGNRSIIPSSSFTRATSERCRGPRLMHRGAEPFGRANAGLRGPKAPGRRASALERPYDVYAPSPARWITLGPSRRGAYRSAE